MNAGYLGGSVFADVEGVRVTDAIIGGLSTDLNSPLALTIWMIQEFAGIPFSPSFYDIEAFLKAAAYVRLSGAGRYVKMGGEKMSEIIDSLMLPCNMTIFPEDGRFTCRRISLYGDEEIYTLYPDELVTPPGIDYLNDAFMTRLSYIYNRSNADEKNSLTIIVDDREVELLKMYRRQVSVEVESPLNDEAQAKEVADERYLRLSFIPTALSVQQVPPVAFRLYDPVLFQYAMNGRDQVPELLYRVAEVDPVARTYKLIQYEETEDTGSVLNLFHRIQGE